MTEFTIEHYEAKPKIITAVEFDGTTDQAHLLIDNGWLDGCDQGFDQAGSHEVLRGRVGSTIVFPTDLIIHHENGDVEVMPADKFDANYTSTSQTETVEGHVVHHVTGDVNPVPDEVTMMQKLPTGENPDAVNLEPDLDDPQDDPQPVEDVASI